ncbi:GNAT family N-acetyltransferase [Sorangium sp. So ce296]|uniref:GNAT family N-acetyltransferase n=1 Tax=Sorangium sp. So ce296 TaxID=3133296 RepID=UPI003F6018E0
MSAAGTSPRSASIHRLVRANNAVWAAMYYDELVDTDDYQLTYMADADAGYYNCAQAVSRSGPDVLAAVEAFYAARGLPPAVYLDPESAPGLRAQLAAAGYAEIPGEAENCHLLDLRGPAPDGSPPEAALRLPVERVRAVRLAGPDDPLFPAFVDVDGTSNELPDAVRRKLAQNLRDRCLPGVEVHCFLALVDGVPASSRVVGFCDGCALYAEGGTLPAYRRLGLYAFLMLHGLAFARARGARFAFQTAAASAHSNPAVLKLGFQRVCTRSYWRRSLV